MGVVAECELDVGEFTPDVRVLFNLRLHPGVAVEEPDAEGRAVRPALGRDDGGVAREVLADRVVHAGVDRLAGLGREFRGLFNGQLGLVRRGRGRHARGLRFFRESIGPEIPATERGAQAAPTPQPFGPRVTDSIALSTNNHPGRPGVRSPRPRESGRLKHDHARPDRPRHRTSRRAPNQPTPGSDRDVCRRL